jgi:hypothetical protein
MPHENLLKKLRMQKKTKSFNLIKPSGTGPRSLNQHAEFFKDKRTKRLRTRSAQRRSDIDGRLREA